MAAHGRPGVTITNVNRGPEVNLASWIPLVITGLIALLKVSSKLVKVRKFQADDCCISLAVVAAVGQTIAVSQQVTAGLGRPASSLSTLQIDSYQKAWYASQFFYIVTLSFGKFTTLTFILTLVQTSLQRTSVLGTMVFTIVWALLALLAIAFQCHVPHTWALLAETCFDQRSFWDGIETLNMFTDLILVGLPVLVLKGLQMPKGKKIAIFAAFALRAIDIPLTILRLVYITDTFSSPDVIYDAYRLAIVTQIGMNASLVVTCAPFLKTFMEQLQPGWSTSDMRTGLGYNTSASRIPRSHTANEYAMGTVVKPKMRPDANWLMTSTRPWLKDPQGGRTMKTTFGDDVESMLSSINPNKKIIRKTTDIRTQSERRRSQ
ncbi:MAG: hypothetical protein M1837_005998 [Sclerophora amabilis]|nr:MAG: hypothetical protein M1837_005998 [Sclerophora amabilis]